MSARQAVALTVGFLVAMAMVVVSILIAASRVPVDTTPAPIVTIRSCAQGCEMLV